MNPEQDRLNQTRDVADWKTWGPYLSERAWGTVREDYSPDGSAWTYFPHEQARSRAYRWNEDGLMGISDRRQLLCFALALWNGKDPILKERPFGLSGPEGNHGEDVKECIYFLDSTPRHSYMKALYKYPHAAFPYERLVQENASRGKDAREFELIDTGIFNENRYFDVQVEYAKADTDDILIRITVFNRGPEEAQIHLLPTLWFRNTWSWDFNAYRPSIHPSADGTTIIATHEMLGDFSLRFDPPTPGLPLMFTENDTNFVRLFKVENRGPHVKDAFHRYLIEGETGAINPRNKGTKVAVPYRLTIAAGKSATVRLRLARGNEQPSAALAATFRDLFTQRKTEADQFYASVAAPGLTPELRSVQRQAFAGLLWSKQFYNFDVRQWLEGDPMGPKPPGARWRGRNHDWQHIANDSVLSMPDTWEYPWYAAWDLAFHTIPLAMIDPDFAKRQLILLLREWFMHPSGQLPAYEWNFGDVNPPVHAWAALRVFQIERKATGKGDRLFLERVFQKLLINFTWWINRKDQDGRNIFQGGFLGLDNIGLFDRSAKLPSGSHLDQSDGTAWMAMFCLNMLAMAIELAREDAAYEDVATKFLEHFFHIAHAMNDRPATDNDDGIDLWDDEDQFYYDLLHISKTERVFLKVRSMVGLIPLLAVENIEQDTFERLPEFTRRLEWFMKNRPHLCADTVSRVGRNQRRLFSIVNPGRLRSILRYVLDESEFLSPYGLRSLSRFHKDHPTSITLCGTHYQVDYEPAESRTNLFGGNSNWRGPVWFPLNYLIIEALQKFDYYYGDEFKIECPTGSGNEMTLWQVTTEISLRLINLFQKNGDGKRAVFGDNAMMQTDPLWSEHLTFNEYFNGDTGEGLGATHQTGWTALIAKLIQQSGHARPVPPRKR